MSERTVPASVVQEIRRSRRHPRIGQYDYLHVRALLRDLSAAVSGLGPEVGDVLDVYCGARPYDDLFPAGTRIVGLDIDHPSYGYGLADVVSDDFLPFPDASFDAVLCTQAFHYILEPDEAMAEIRRVLRPGGAVVITVPVVWEYDRRTPEHHYTEPVLRRLLDGWDDVQVVESGGWGVSWAAVSGSLLRHVEELVAPRRTLAAVSSPLFTVGYVTINGIGQLLELVDRRLVRGPLRLPMNLLVSARRPAES